jgi:putative sterol carrier protein
MLNQQYVTGIPTILYGTMTFSQTGGKTKDMATPREIFERMERKIRERTDEFSKVGGVYKFVLRGPDGGTWVVDLRKETFGIRESDEEAQCKVALSSVDFVRIATGELSAESAFMRGKLKLFGDLGLAMKLGKLFGK